MATHTARCATCLTELTIQVDVDLSDIKTLIQQQGEQIMANFDALAAAVLTLTNTVQRVAADLEALKNSGGLSADQQAILDKAVADLTGDEATLESADPAPAAPVEPAPAPETPQA